MLDLSVIVVSWNTRELTRRCLATLREELTAFGAECGACGTEPGAHGAEPGAHGAEPGAHGAEPGAHGAEPGTSAAKWEVFLVDNDSADGTADMVRREHSWVKLIANAENLGFARANNQAIKQSSGRLLLLLNPDTEVQRGSIRTLVRYLETRPEVGVVAPQLLNSDGSIQRSCREFPTFIGMVYELIGLSKLFPNNKTFGRYKMLDFNHDSERQVDQPEGACLLVRREVIDKVGLLDEAFFMLFEEVDWCYRIKKDGWQIWFTPYAKVVHHYGQSIKQVKAKMILSSHKGLYRFWFKHYRGDRWYLDAFAYSGLMALAYVRILAMSLKRMATGGAGA